MYFVACVLFILPSTHTHFLPEEASDSGFLKVPSVAEGNHWEA